MWSESLRLNLNIILVNTTLRLPVEHQLARKSTETTPSNRLSSLTSFHHCLSSATSVLDNFVHMDPEQLSFATDTLLHFALYAATLLWTVSLSSKGTWRKLNSLSSAGTLRLVLLKKQRSLTANNLS